MYGNYETMLNNRAEYYRAISEAEKLGLDYEMNGTISDLEVYGDVISITVFEATPSENESFVRAVYQN